MFNDLNTALSYVESRRTKRTLSQFKETVEKYGFNISQKNMIHIAGTNGKGSTTNYIKEILLAHGYHVGTFTSPYLLCHNDRICIDGVMISDDDLLRIINELYVIIESEGLSMFEIDILIMLKYFDSAALDYRIIEAGIGGKQDKTNLINSICSVITNIGYDHQFMLGNTLEAIAKQKAGIIKENKPCFTAEKNKSLQEIFQTVCQQANSQINFITPVADGYPYRFKCCGYKYYLENCGGYQVENAALAISVCDSLIDLDSGKVQMALNKFKWPGRFEKFGRIYLDGAHNVSGIEALLKTIEQQKLDDVVIIFSALNDKDITAMLSLLQKYPIIQASFKDERSSSEGLAFETALNQALAQYKHIIVTGSLHFISAVRKYLLSNKAVSD